MSEDYCTRCFAGQIDSKVFGWKKDGIFTDYACANPRNRGAESMHMGGCET